MYLDIKKFLNNFGLKKWHASQYQVEPKVGWILLGDVNTGSSRIHGINIHNFLLENGIESAILQSNPKINSCLTLSAEEQKNILSSGYTHLIFQKVHDNLAVKFAMTAKKKGINVVYLLSDLHETEMVKTADIFVVTSQYLKEYFDASCGTRARVIDDAIECTNGLLKEHADKGELKLIWVGHEDNWNSVNVVKKAIDQIKNPLITLATISKHLDADVEWLLETVNSEIVKGDVAVIPVIDSQWTRCKSNNRLTLFMSLGIPVIASEIPSYKNILKYGINGFFARDEDEWVAQIKKLQDSKVRSAIAKQAFHDVMDMYSIGVIGNKWKLLLQESLCCNRR